MYSLLIEGISADKLTNKARGRDLKIYVCFVDEVKHLYYGVHLIVVNVGGLNLKEQGEDVLFQHCKLVESRAVEYNVGILLEGEYPSLLASSYRIPHIKGTANRCASCFVVTNYAAKKSKIA